MALKITKLNKITINITVSETKRMMVLERRRRKLKAAANSASAWIVWEKSTRERFWRAIDASTAFHGVFLY